MRSKREYGIDLLKIVAMCMVLCNHIILVMYGDVLPHATLGAWLVQLFHAFCYCAVDCFVMATGYVMVSKEWKARRIFKLWLQVVMYSLLICIVASIFFPEVAIGKRGWLAAAMPVTCNAYWFVTAYVGLFFTMPYLNKLLNSLSLRETLTCVLSGFVLLSVWTVFSGRELFNTAYGYSYVWFLYLYVVGAALAKLKERNSLLSCGQSVVVVLCGVALSAAMDELSHYLTCRYGCGGRFGVLKWSYASPTILLASVGWTIFFAKLECNGVGLQRCISFIAPSIFVVYIVHCNDVFKQIVDWEHVFTHFREGAASAVGCTVACALALMGIIVLVDHCLRLFIKCIRYLSMILRRTVIG